MTELASLLRVHDTWHAYDPHNGLYAREVHSSVVTLLASNHVTCKTARM